MQRVGISGLDVFYANLILITSFNSSVTFAIGLCGVGLKIDCKVAEI